MWYSGINCPACGKSLTESQFLGIKKERELSQLPTIECRNCGLQLPTWDNILDLRVGRATSSLEVTLRDSVAQQVDSNTDILERAARHYYIPGVKRHIKKFVGGIKAQGTILDIGIGLGWYWQDIEETFRVVGVEFSMATLLRARKILPPHVSLICSNICDLKVEECSFDGVWSSQVLQHIESTSEVEKVISQVYRALRPGGIFELRWLNRSGLARTLRGLTGMSYPTQERTGQLFVRRLVSSELYRLVSSVFGSKQVQLQYEENLFHPELGARHRYTWVDPLEAKLEKCSWARFTGRQIAVRAVK